MPSAPSITSPRLTPMRRRICAARRNGRVHAGDRVLYVSRAFDRIHGAGEFGHQAVADAAEDAAVEFPHQGVEDPAPDCERGKCAGLVGAHQPAVIDHVCREDRGNLAAVPDHGRLADRRGSIAPPVGENCPGGMGAAVADLRSGKERGAMCIVIHERRVTPPDHRSARPRGLRAGCAATALLPPRVDSPHFVGRALWPRGARATRSMPPGQFSPWAGRRLRRGCARPS